MRDAPAFLRPITKERQCWIKLKPSIFGTQWKITPFIHLIDTTDTLLYVTKNRLFLLYTDLRWPSFAAAVATFLWACEFSLLFWRLYPFNSLSAFYEKTIPDKIKSKNGWPVNSPNLTVSRFFFLFFIWRTSWRKSVDTALKSVTLPSVESWRRYGSA